MILFSEIILFGSANFSWTGAVLLLCVFAVVIMVMMMKDSDD
jgi:integral membrane sensor domain MASE1